ncbi:MAG: N-acetylmuramoyl-L-alanine amidase [Solobacterium sp.]|nr:N-acetylmuramoyl-L-alanine amidase [Solobacterium sp.]
MTKKKKKRRLRKEMRIIAFIILGLIVLIGGLVTYQLLSERKPSDRHVIMLDAAHGGDASGYQGLISEDEYNEQVIDALAAMFANDTDYEILRTRENGQAMAVSTRVEVINEARPDLVLSVRCYNNDSPSFDGMKIFAQPAGSKYHKDSAAFAGLIDAAFQEQGVASTAGYYYFHPIKAGYFQDHLVPLEDETDYGEATYDLMAANAPVVICAEFNVDSEYDTELWASEDGIATAAKLYYTAIKAMFEKN